VFTPVRMFYDLRRFFYETAPWVCKDPFAIWAGIHKRLLERQLKYVDKIATISGNVQKRIAKYFNRESTIIYPAVKQYKYIKQGNYWLSVNRLYPHKRVELQIEAFRQMPEEKLYIVGGFMQGDNARDYAKKDIEGLAGNVRYLGVVSEEN